MPLANETNKEKLERDVSVGDASNVDFNKPKGKGCLNKLGRLGLALRLIAQILQKLRK